jgi:hypothetical protein
LTYIPYRSLLPKGVDNMLVACRAFSSDQTANNFFNLIPHCIAMGEAAGTAAALSLDQGVDVRSVDIKALQKQLMAQNVPLPGNLGHNDKKGQAEAYTFRTPAFGAPPPSANPNQKDKISK